MFYPQRGGGVSCDEQALHWMRSCNGSLDPKCSRFVNNTGDDINNNCDVIIYYNIFAFNWINLNKSK